MNVPAAPLTPRRLAGAAALFLAIGLALYICLLAAAERLVFTYGDSNPLFRIATDRRERHDWVILGASHAMPLTFGGFGDTMERETGLAILNLSATGAGPLYERFVLQEYLRSHRAAHVLYVIDSFAFYSRSWNEERFADARLLARTPWRLDTLGTFGRYVEEEGVSWRGWLDYATGFSKINNRDRFKPDRWEGETQFDQTWRHSTSAVRKRIDYLYPDGAAQAEFDRHLAQFQRLVSMARETGARFVVVKLPLPGAYRGQLPDEPAFDAAMARFASANDIAWRDLSDTFDDPRYFFDSDHLNRAGVARLFGDRLRTLLTAPSPARAMQP